MSKNNIAVVAALLLGSAAGATVPSISAQAFASEAPDAPRYLQFCEHFRGDNATEDMDAAVRSYGVHGFLIASHAFDQSNGVMACFSRHTPAR